MARRRNREGINPSMRAALDDTMAVIAAYFWREDLFYDCRYSAGVEPGWAGWLALLRFSSIQPHCLSNIGTLAAGILLAALVLFCARSGNADGPGERGRGTRAAGTTGPAPDLQYLAGDARTPGCAAHARNARRNGIFAHECHPLYRAGGRGHGRTGTLVRCGSRELG